MTAHSRLRVHRSTIGTRPRARHGGNARLRGCCVPATLYVTSRAPPAGYSGCAVYDPGWREDRRRTVRPLVSEELCYDLLRLLQLVESLGENCDLGVVQRAVGIEPFGLFRFAGCNPDSLAALLRERFQSLGAGDDLWFDEVGPTREYWVKSRSCTFEAHTNRYAGRDDLDVVRRNEIDRMRYLKARLLADLARGEKLCVYKGHSSAPTMRDIAAQLQGYGPNTLLWVDLADDTHAAATVERDSPKLLRGFVSRFGTYDDAGPSLPVAEWVALCLNAYRLWRNEEPPRTTLDNLISRAHASRSCEWSGDRRAVTRLIAEPASARGLSFEHRVGSAELTAVCCAQLAIPAGGNFVLSVWVNLPPGFSARQVSLLFPGCDSLLSWRVDLGTRGSWQRIWLSASVPSEARSIVCALLAEGAADQVFHSAHWCLERGTRPSGYHTAPVELACN
jgi:hypothetical protein